MSTHADDIGYMNQLEQECLEVREQFSAFQKEASEEYAKLKAENRELRRRIRAARKTFDDVMMGQTYATWVEEELALERLLDLRKGKP